MSKATIEIRPDPETLAQSLAAWIVERFERSSGPFALNLSGGSTPKRLYRLLGSDTMRTKFDWKRVHVFFGDERFVPHDHPDSNYGMIRQALLDHVPIPGGNVHPVPFEGLSPEQAAARYGRELQTFGGCDTLDPSRPLFAVTLLGLGDDGHTASLFPGTDVLTERDEWVVSVVGAKPEPRISMTFPVLESSHDAVFLVQDEKKRSMLRRLVDRDKSIPAGMVEPRGTLTIFADEAACDEALRRSA